MKEKAPVFKLTDHLGNLIDFESYKGKKVWLSFYRYASCPLCNLRIAQIRSNHKKLQDMGVEALAVFQSGPQSMKKYVASMETPFPLLCDPEETVYRLYGNKSSFLAFFSLSYIVLLVKAAFKGFFPGKIEGTFSRIPGDFLIDEEMNIIDSFHGRDIGDHIPWERVWRFAKNET